MSNDLEKTSVAHNSQYFKWNLLNRKFSNRSLFIQRIYLLFLQKLLSGRAWKITRSLAHVSTETAGSSEKKTQHIKSFVRVWEKQLYSQSMKLDASIESPKYNWGSEKKEGKTYKHFVW